MDNGTLSQAEKLEALVRKAIEGGWKPMDHMTEWKVIDAHPRMYLGMHVRRKLITAFDDEIEHARLFIPEVIFNHDCARALFGEGSYYKLNEPKRTVRKLWEHELQQAVISDNPIDYMYGAVFGESGQ